MRPGGLTALAVFNFIFGGLSGIANLISLATMGLAMKALRENAERTGEPIPSEGVMYGLALFALVRAGLLITSGVGYLGMKRTTGWVLGNTYAVLALVAIAVQLTMVPNAFNFFGLIDFVYPLITLFLLNVIFRRDFK